MGLSLGTNTFYLKDVATVSFKEKDRTTFAREYGNQVVMLDVKKRSGKNMVAVFSGKGSSVFLLKTYSGHVF